MNGISIVLPARAALVLVLAALLPGCYVMQAASGQLAVMTRRAPIERVLADPTTPESVRSRLASVEAIREFAIRELDLPDNGSYRKYADIGRPYVVWNVVAAPEFSLQPKRWCFPVAGCVAYRGYFREARARSFARRMTGRGFDVTVGGVAAYSTLGHFDDPILSSMLGWSDVQLAAIIFHELTHQLIYVRGDSAFNEALATTVEQEGVTRWLSAAGRTRDLQASRLWQARTKQVMELIGSARSDLARLYSLRLSPAQMLQRKDGRFERLTQEYVTLSADWGREAPYQAWFAQPLNNASLAAVATYNRCIPGFVRLLHEAGGELPRFYERVRSIARMPAAQRDQQVCAGG